MKDRFIKVAAGTPEIRVADVEFNKESILKLIKEAADKEVKILCLPELCLTGCTCGDLFLQDVLIKGAKKALGEILEKTANVDMLFTLGLPAMRGGRLYSCAAICRNGELLGLVPKTLSDSSFERRWFEDGERGCATFDVDGMSVDVVAGDGDGGRALCAPTGAAVVLCLGAEPETIGRAAFRREAAKSCSCAYVYAGAGEGESTTDAVYAGHCIIAAKGEILAEKRFEPGLVAAKVEAISFKAPQAGQGGSSLLAGKKPSASPFVPQLAEDCEDALQIAALGLKKRVEHVGAKKLVLGVSGGLDSTLALLISAKALDMLKLPRENLMAVTMPGFGTTGRTRGNAGVLAGELGATLREIRIDEAVRRHFADIGYNENTQGIVYENAQARERTQILMDIANSCGGLVVGTGDMSELALGWATYCGDHMSMYGVNAGIPKTLVRRLVAYAADIADNESLSRVLRDILETPVSPELLPAEDGGAGQKTEDIVGPYELHDFFLYHLIRWGSAPEKVLSLAEYAFDGVYDRETILKWLKVFISRFFSQQFKRSCLPDGPKVVDFSLSPRGGWQMPSDASAALWLRELEGL